MAEAEGAPDSTLDAFYGGRLMLRQPRKGHRSGTDAVLLAASVPRAFGGLLIDAGSGVGAAGLGVALACPQARVLLLENDPATVGLASVNIAANGLEGRATVSSCDLLDRAARQIVSPKADVVVTNPPFYETGVVRVSPSANRSAAHVLAAGTTLADWIAACLDLLAPKGILIMVHAASAVPEILAAVDRRLGAITVKPIQPQDGVPAKRVLVRGLAGSRAPFVLAAPLSLHRSGAFTAEAEALHRGDVALDW